MDSEHPRMKVLGQHIPCPAIWHAVSGVLIVAALVGFVARVYFVKAGHEQLEAFSSFVQHKYSAQGRLEEKISYRIIQFWTTPEKTQKDFGQHEIEGEDPQWQTVCPSQRVTDPVASWLNTTRAKNRYPYVESGKHWMERIRKRIDRPVLQKPI